MKKIVLQAGDLLLSHPWEGEIGLDFSFEGHGSASLSLAVGNSGLEAFKAALRKNSGLVSLLGWQWFVSSVEQTESDDPAVALLSLSLSGRHAERSAGPRASLDTPQVLKPLMSGNKLPLANMGSFNAPDVIQILNEVSDTEEGTLRGFLEAYARSYRCYLYWDGSQPALRRWGAQATQAIEVVKAPITWSEPGQGALLDQVQLTEDIRDWRKFEPDAQVAGDFDYTYTETVDDRDSDSSSLFVSDSPAIDYDAFRTGGGWFDNGGYIKTRTTTTRTNGRIIVKTIKRWGFVGSSLDSHSIVTSGSTKFLVFTPGFLYGNIVATWQLFEDFTETYERDPDGYLIRIRRVGYTTIRARQETNELQAINYELERQSSSSVAAATAAANKRDLYATFHQVTLAAGDDDQTWTLVNAANYYPEATGKVILKEAREYRGVKIFEDYENEDYYNPNIPPADVPKLVCGEQFSQVIKNRPLIPFNSSSRKRLPETFEQVRSRKNSHREGLATSLEEKETAHIDGRLPEQGDRLLLTGNPPPTEMDQPTYFFGYPDPGPSGRKEGSFSFPGVSDPGQAKLCMEADLSIRNTQRARTGTLRVIPDLSLQVGNFVVWQDRQYAILSISHQLEIAQGAVWHVSTEIQVGQVLQPILYQLVEAAP